MKGSNTISIAFGVGVVATSMACAPLSRPVTQREQTAAVGGLAGGAGGAIIGSMAGGAVAGGLFGIPIGGVGTSAIRWHARSGSQRSELRRTKTRSSGFAERTNVCAATLTIARHAVLGSRIKAPRIQHDGQPRT